MKITKQMVRSYHEQANAALKNQIEYDFPKLFKEDLWDKPVDATKQRNG